MNRPLSITLNHVNWGAVAKLNNSFLTVNVCACGSVVTRR